MLKKSDSSQKMKVLNLQAMAKVAGGRMAVQSSQSNNCGTVTGWEQSTQSNGCPRETR